MTIGLIDGPVNWKIPELQGADIEYMSRCDVESSDDSWEHGTVIAQMMVAPDFGIAPKARLNRYTASLMGDTAGDDCAIGWWSRGYSETSVLIELALNDGVDVVSISSTYGSDSESMRWALARAITQKVPIVVSMGNESEYNPPKSLARMTGVVGVASVEPDGSLASYSNYGAVDPRSINADDSYQYRGFDEWIVLSREHGYPTHLGTSPRYHAVSTKK